MRRLTLGLVLLAGCDESPFGTRHAVPGEEIIGRLQPEVSGSNPCIVWSPPPGFPTTGLGDGDYFYVANSNSSTPQLHAYEQPAAGQSLVEHGTAITADVDPIVDVAVKGGHCPFVSTVQHVAPAPFMSGQCSGEQNYQRGPVFFAFDSANTFYYAYQNRRSLGREPVVGQAQEVVLPVDALRITIHISEVWVAYKVNADTWEILAYDKGTLKLKGHIQFPWPNGDLAGMVWDDNVGNLVAIANDRVPAICSYVFVPLNL